MNIAVKGLHYRSAPYTSSKKNDNDLLVFNLPLNKSLVYYAPRPENRMYRALETVDVDDLAVSITDCLDVQRSPQFHVGISDITLHFRKIWNNPFR